MATLILGPMLRHVSHTSATIWVETDQRCTVKVLGCSTSTFCVESHHYALVIVEGLQPGTTTEYDVLLDGVRCWPEPVSGLPPSTIRTLGHDGPTRVAFGSCRTAAPHEPPWTLELSLDHRGRGVDALYAYAMRMLTQPSDEWPHLAVFLGDQVYADDSSPKTREKIAAQREREQATVDSTLPTELVDGFEEFTWLYHESWSPTMERWFFSNVPSTMIFDDHEMIDDWNISAEWVAEIRQQPWWKEHVVGGLMTYWLYQHLGNLAPSTIRDEGILDDLLRVPDGTERLRQWALRSEEFTSGPDNYRFHFFRELGPVRLVMIDARNGRQLTPGERRIVDDKEWEWIVEACKADVDHLLIGSSLPVFVPGGMHDLQVWNEALADGAWAKPGRRLAEWSRVKADMEDWPAFGSSFTKMVDLIRDVGSARRDPPATISVLSGDIHFSYVAEVVFPPAASMVSRVHQVVNSPIRNVLTGPEKTAMRLGTSRFGGVLGRLLRWTARRDPAKVAWEVDAGPIFENSIGLITFTGRQAAVEILQTRRYQDGTRPELDAAIDADLAAGAHGRFERVSGTA